MAIKDLLVCVDQTDDAVVRLRLAADLAIRHRSRLTALFAQEWTQGQLQRRKTAELGLVSSNQISMLDEGVAAEIEAVTARLQQILEQLTEEHGVAAELLSIAGTAANAVPQYARYADLCIVGQNEPEGPASINYTFSEQLLFVTGRAQRRSLPMLTRSSILGLFPVALVAAAIASIPRITQPRLWPSIVRGVR